MYLLCWKLSHPLLLIFFQRSLSLIYSNSMGGFFDPSPAPGIRLLQTNKQIPPGEHQELPCRRVLLDSEPPPKRRRLETLGSHQQEQPPSANIQIIETEVGLAKEPSPMARQGANDNTTFRGGRLVDFAPVWEKLGAPRCILNIVKGYSIPFIMKPPLVPLSSNGCERFSTPGMKNEIQRMLEQGILEKSNGVMGFLSRLFPVQKADGGIRPIFNLRGLNRYLHPRKFRLINHFKVPSFLQRGDFTAKLDLTQAYFHVPIKTQHRRFLSLISDGRVLQMTCLPFGLSSAPLTFARLSNWIASQLRDRGIRIIVYLDDFLLADQNPVCLRHHVSEAILFMETLGWSINRDKSLEIPTTRIEYLGIIWDTQNDVICLPEKKKASLRKDLEEVVNHGVWSWALGKKLLGKLSFASFVIPLGRLYTRQMQRASNLLPELLPKKTFPIPQTALEEAQWWLQNLNSSSHLFPRNPQVFVTTDASNQGWGAQVGDKIIQHGWSPHQVNWHINRKELYAVYAALRLSADDLRGKSVLIQSDNRTVVSYIRNQGGTKSASLCKLSTSLLRLTHSMDIVLSAHYIPGPYNEVADSLSRGKLLPDWHLSESVTRLIFQRWGTPQIDLFATHRSKVVPLYVSRNARDPLACFTDAFSRKWNFSLAWVFPPPSLVPRVLNHLNSATGTYILVVPRWERVFWRADIRSRALAPPFQLRNLQHHLVDAQTGTPLYHARVFRLEAWKIRGGPSVRPVGPRKT